MAALRHGIIHVCFVLVWMVICFPVVTFQRSVNTTTTPVHHKDDVPFNLTPVGKILINGSIVGIVLKVMYHIVICISFKNRRSHLVFTDRLRKEFAKRKSFQTVEQCCCCKYCVCFGILGINCLFWSYVCDRFCGSSVDLNPSSQTLQTPDRNDEEIEPIPIPYKHVERIVNDFVNYRLGHKKYCYKYQCVNEDHNNFAATKRLHFKAVTYLFVLDFTNRKVKQLGTGDHVHAEDVVWLSIGHHIKTMDGKVNDINHPELIYMEKKSKEICLIVLNTSEASPDAMNVVKDFLEKYDVTLYYSSDRSERSVITKEPRSCFGIGCCCSKNESSKDMEEQNLLPNKEQTVSWSTGNGESSGTKETPLQLNPDVFDGIESGSIQMSDNFQATNNQIQESQLEGLQADKEISSNGEEISSDGALSVAEEKPMQSNPDLAKGNARDSTQMPDLKLSDLKFKHQNELRSYLDPDYGTGIKNWLHVGHELCQDDKVLSATVDSLKLHYAGGGSPAMAFLKSLVIKHPETTVKRFKEIAQKLDRNDIVSDIDKQMDLNEQLTNINHEHLERFAYRLNDQVTGLSDWRSFADEFNYSRQEISNFATTVKSQNKYSPTLQLLVLLEQSKPTLTLNQFANACERLHRRDVSEYIANAIQELSGN